MKKNLLKQRTPARLESQARAYATQLAAASLSMALASSSFAATPPLMFGVNLSGGEGGKLHSMSNTESYSDGQLRRNYPRGRFGWDYNYPTQPVFNYYRARGITLVRLPIKWERIQHSLGAALDATEMTRIDAAIECARVSGMQVLLDLHNYNRYSPYVNGTWTSPGLVVNAQPNPVVTIAHFTNVWQQLATRYANSPAIYGYDIMNEPAGSVVNWRPAAQAAVNTIRTYDKKHWIVVEGVNWSHSHDWVSTNPEKNNTSINITDSAGKLIYSAHSYWDIGYQNNVDDWKYDGQYNSYAAEGGNPDMGANSLVPFVNWIKANGYNGLIGEYGVPWATDASSWSTVLDRSLAYLKTNGISGTYWTGGLWMGAGAYQISCQANSLGATDLPSMTVMRKYGGVVYETETVSLVTSSGETVNLISEDPLSQGKGEQFMANGVGDYIIYTVPNVPAGTYNVFVRVKKYSSRGTFQLAIAGANGGGGYVNQGAPQNLYQGSTSYNEINLGTKTFSTTGDKDFRFTVTGKHASSSGYNLLIDYIQLQK